VGPFEDGHVLIQVFLVHAAKRAKEISKPRPNAFRGVVVDFANPVAVIVPRPLPFSRRMTDCDMAAIRLGSMMIRLPFIPGAPGPPLRFGVEKANPGAPGLHSVRGSLAAPRWRLGFGSGRGRAPLVSVHEAFGTRAMNAKKYRSRLPKEVGAPEDQILL